MKIYERPRCQKEGCGELAITVYASTWLCGRCIEKVCNKIKQKQMELFLTE